MKTSINFKVVKSDSETHNFRKKTFDYIRKDLTPKNEYWMEQKIADRIQKIEAYCKEKSGRKLQKNAMPVREAVVVIKENTTMMELQNLAKRLEEELSIRVFQIVIHKDEGHTDIQVENQAFAATHIPLSSTQWRDKSNEVFKNDYKTGYHEIIPTNLILHLIKAKDLKNGTHKLPTTTKEIFNNYDIINSSTLKHILLTADGFRTDTAQTILSGPGGTVAAHSGSELGTKYQAAAHNLLRVAVLDLLEHDPKRKGFTSSAIQAILGAIAVTSMAPGIIIRDKLDSTNLKATPAKKDWEENRNIAKWRVNRFYSKLNNDEKEFAREFTGQFFYKIDRSQSKSLVTSPFRLISGSAAKEVSGGSYLDIFKFSENFKQFNDVAPPSDLKLMGFYFTEPFRAQRRK